MIRGEDIRWARQQDDLRRVDRYVRQIERANYQAAMERASREIQHDNYRLERFLNRLGLHLIEDTEVSIERI